MDDATSTVKILLVFPSKLTQFMLSQALQGEGFVDVIKASSLQQAQNAIEQEKPNVVIASMYFSDGDAKQLLQKLKQIQSRLHFLLVSAEHRWHQLDPVKQSGIVAVLKKPIDNDQLLKAMRFIESLEQGGLHDAQFSNLKVLLADDSALAREHMRQVLHELSVHQIVEFENGQEALDHLLKTPVDVVISDYHMPKMNGEQLLQSVRGIKSLEGLPVVLVSSEREDVVLDRLQALNAEACLDKPFDIEQLKAVLMPHALFSAVNEKL